MSIFYKSSLTFSLSLPGKLSFPNIGLIFSQVEPGVVLFAHLHLLIGLLPKKIKTVI